MVITLVMAVGGGAITGLTMVCVARYIPDPVPAIALFSYCYSCFGS